MSPFEALLDARLIPCRRTLDGLLVQGDLDLTGCGLVALPDHLTIDGHVILSDTPLTELPRGLRVQGTLLLSKTLITQLPEALSVEGDLLLDGSQITSLPVGFRVQGSLAVRSTPITALPEGLHVGKDLDFLDTAITGLPARMQVDGMIFPTRQLHDIQVFMAAQSGTVRLSLPDSHHQRLELRHRLRPFPDLLRVLDAIPRGWELVIDAEAIDGPSIQVNPSVWAP